MDDDDLDRAMEAIRRRAQAWEIAELDRMESTLSHSTPAAFYKDVPPPGFCHPYHKHRKRFITDWLDGKSSIGGYNLVLPVVERMKFAFVDLEALPTISSPKTIIMRREKAFATAPYVGRPFVYWWWAGVDDHGRGVGGMDTTLAHTCDFDPLDDIPYVTGVHEVEGSARWSLERGWILTCDRCGQKDSHPVHGGDDRG